MSHKLLILEDDPQLGPLLKASLEKAGYRVSLHGDATSALEEFEAGNFDCVIADMFVVKDGVHTRDGGISLISAIRQVRRSKLPIIAISGAFSAETGFYARTSAMTVGADTLLDKPFSPAQLIAAIEDVLSTKR